MNSLSTLGLEYHLIQALIFCKGGHLLIHVCPFRSVLCAGYKEVGRDMGWLCTLLCRDQKMLLTKCLKQELA